MKTINEFKDEVLKRKDAYMQKRKKRMMITASFCAFFLISTGIISAILFLPKSGGSKLFETTPSPDSGSPFNGIVLSIEKINNGHEDTLTFYNTEEVVFLYNYLKDRTMLMGDPPTPPPTSPPTPTPTEQTILPPAVAPPTYEAEENTGGNNDKDDEIKLVFINEQGDTFVYIIKKNVLISHNGAYEMFLSSELETTIIESLEKIERGN